MPVHLAVWPCTSTLGSKGAPCTRLSGCGGGGQVPRPLWACRAVAPLGVQGVAGCLGPSGRAPECSHRGFLWLGQQSAGWCHLFILSPLLPSLLAKDSGCGHFTGEEDRGRPACGEWLSCPPLACRPDTLSSGLAAGPQVTLSRQRCRDRVVLCGDAGGRLPWPPGAGQAPRRQPVAAGPPQGLCGVG